MIRLQTPHSWVEIDPEHGGQVKSWEVGGEAILFPDQLVSTPSGSKRRGGIPILFPNAGPLSDTSLYKLKQHGFARDLPWQVTEKSREKLCLSLSSDSETEKLFPFQWKLENRLFLKERSLRLELSILNTGSEPMPIAAGLHPYFAVPVSEKRDIQLSLPSWAPKEYNWSDTLIFPAQENVLFQVPNRYALRLTVSVEYFKYWMLWSELESGQVCIEPWMGEDDALLAAKNLIQPNKQLTLFLNMEVSDGDVSI